MRTWRIVFIRKADGNENIGWYDEEAGLVFDETEFDSEYTNMEVVFVDLINLFNQFVEENHFEDVTVTELTEVPYDGEEE